LDRSVARLIKKLLVKDPAERWTAAKCLASNFFQLKEDTTQAEASSGERAPSQGAAVSPRAEPHAARRSAASPPDASVGRPQPRLGRCAIC
jgi:serine/threonine protein kinase